MSQSLHATYLIRRLTLISLNLRFILISVSEATLLIALFKLLLHLLSILLCLLKHLRYNLLLHLMVTCKRIMYWCRNTTRCVDGLLYLDCHLRVPKLHILCIRVFIRLDGRFRLCVKHR